MAILTTLYGLQGLALAASYAPQLRSVWRSKTGAQDISIVTWLFWSATSLISLFYAFNVVKDMPFAAVSATTLVGSVAVSVVAAVRRFQHGRTRGQGEGSYVDPMRQTEVSPS